MNGMGNKETFVNMTGLSSSRVLEGITSIGVKFSGDGFIELKGWGKTFIEDKICEKKIYEKTRKFLEIQDSGNRALRLNSHLISRNINGISSSSTR